MDTSINSRSGYGSRLAQKCYDVCAHWHTLARGGRVLMGRARKAKAGGRGKAFVRSETEESLLKRTEGEGDYDKDKFDELARPRVF